jgi:hypothetical protein
VMYCPDGIEISHGLAGTIRVPISGVRMTPVAVFEFLLLSTNRVSDGSLISCRCDIDPLESTVRSCRGLVEVAGAISIRYPDGSEATPRVSRYPLRVVLRRDILSGVEKNDPVKNDPVPPDIVAPDDTIVGPSPERTLKK